MIQRTWDEIPPFYPDFDIDAFVVMPNHIHGIVFLLPRESDLYPTSEFRDERTASPVGAPPRGRPRTGTPDSDSETRPIDSSAQGNCCDSTTSGRPRGRPRGGAPTDDVSTEEDLFGSRLSLSDVMERFKSLTTHRYRLGVRDEGWTPYDRKLWQRNFYERIVRNDRELDRFRRYIEANPAKWFEDPYRNLE
jgi:REP element-mobilizing transposase RayT